MSVTRRNIRDSTSVSESIIEAIAEARDVPPTELMPPLYEAIDPDTLDRLVQSVTEGRMQLTFEYQSYEIQIKNNDIIEVYPKGTKLRDTDDSE